MIINRDGKMRPIVPPRTLEDQSDDEFVVRANAGNTEPSQMKIELVVTEPVGSDELEQRHGGMRGVQDVDFGEEDAT